MWEIVFRIRLLLFLLLFKWFNWIFPTWFKESVQALCKIDFFPLYFPFVSFTIFTSSCLGYLVTMVIINGGFGCKIDFFYCNWWMMKSGRRSLSNNSFTPCLYISYILDCEILNRRDKNHLKLILKMIRLITTEPVSRDYSFFNKQFAREVDRI
jgi:hypothetical protein